MGFMAGFGPSFGRSFEGAKDRAHDARQDAFRLTYQDYMQRQQQYDEWNREDGKYVKAAQDYEQMYDLPEGSWTQIYSWKKTGMSDEQIQEFVQKGQWSVAETAEKVASPAGPQGIDAEMQDVGMSPSQSQVPTQGYSGAAQEPQRDTGLFGSLLGNLAQKGKKKTGSIMEKRRAGAIDRIAQETGRPVEEINDTMSGYKAPVLPESNVTFKAPAPAQAADPLAANANEAYVEQAQAKTAAERNPTPENIERARVADERVAAIVDRAFMDAEVDAISKGLSQDGTLTTIWKDGKYVKSGRVKKNPDGTTSIMVPNEGVVQLGEGETAINMTKEELALREKANTELFKLTEDLDAKRSNIIGAFTQLNAMNETVRNTNSEVLKDNLAAPVAKLEQWVVEIAAGAQKIAEMAGADPEKAQANISEEAISKLIAAEKALLQTDKTDLGSQKLLYDTQKAIMAYRIGAAMGQSDRSLSETERKMFADMVAAGVTVDQFYNNMSTLLMPIVKEIDASGQAAYNKAGGLFDAQYDYTPNEFIYDPLSAKLSTGETAEIYGELKNRDRSGSATIIKTGPSNTNQGNQNLPTYNTPQEVPPDLPSDSKFKAPDGKGGFVIRTKP